MSLDVRSFFPALDQKVHDKPLVYLDSAASTLKARPVIDAMQSFDSRWASNVHRGAHYLSDQATGYYEKSREQVRSFLNAKETGEIIFTRNTTESLNLVATSLSFGQLQPGDEIVLTEMEHHSNIVPWQLAAERTGAVIKVIPMTDDGQLDLANVDQIVSSKTKVLSMVYVSNALGTINPVEKLIAKAKAVGAITILDAAQAVAVMPVDVQALGCDFLAFSGHKIFGPFGIGVLYGRKALLDQMAPYQGGGSMIDRVSFEKTTYLSAPHRFEAGTPNVTGAIGLGEACQFVDEIGRDKIFESEKALLSHMSDQLGRMSGLRLYGTSDQKTNVQSFLLEGVHPSDVGQILDREGVAVRTGHHCCQPMMAKFKVPGTIRASLSIYSDESDVDRLVKAVLKSKEFFE